MSIYAHCDGLTNHICTISICLLILSLLLLIDGDGVTLYNALWKAEGVGERKVNVRTVVLNCWSALGGFIPSEKKSDLNTRWLECRWPNQLVLT